MTSLLTMPAAPLTLLAPDGKLGTEGLEVRVFNRLVNIATPCFLPIAAILSFRLEENYSIEFNNAGFLIGSLLLHSRVFSSDNLISF